MGHEVVEPVLYCGDCLEVMRGIDSDSVDMVLADPPYGTTACKWDAVIPFDQMWSHLERIVKPNGALVMTTTQPFTTALISSNRDLFRYELIWCKNRPTGLFNVNKMPMRAHENIIVFYGSLPVYNPQKIKRTEKELKRFAKKPVTTKTKDSVYGNIARNGPNRNDSKMKHPNTLISIDVVHGRSREKVKHPTQKPVALMEYLIKTYTNEGETVLDFTMGSGTTGVACANLGRHFIGIEKDPGYFEIAKRRIEESLTVQMELA